MGSLSCIHAGRCIANLCEKWSASVGEGHQCKRWFVFCSHLGSFSTLYLWALIGICRWASPISEVIDNRSGILASHYFCYLSGLGILSMSCCDRITKNAEIYNYAKRKYLSSFGTPSIYCLWQYCLSSDTVTSSKCHYFARFTFCKEAFLAHKSLVDICNDRLDTLKCILIYLSSCKFGNWYWHLDWPFQIRQYSQIWRLVLTTRISA